MGSESTLVKPEPGQNDYGTIYSEKEADIINGTIRTLVHEYSENNYATYPMGFYKSVTLSETESKKIEAYISEFLGASKDEWSFESMQTVDYDKFLTIMSEIETIIGKGSRYSKSFLQTNARISMTYEQALGEYESILIEDKVTGAYARLFCDYLGIILGILPAFFGVTRVLKDKRSKVSAVLYSKKCSPCIIILSRCLAMITMLLIPLLLISCLSLAESVYIGKALDVQPDYFAYLKYCVGWLLPTIMFTSTLAYLITEMTESVLAILISGTIWFASIFSGMSVPLISVGWNLIPRFNELGMHSMFETIFSQLVINRIVYVCLGILMMILTVVIYDLKRKGGYQIRGKVFKNRNSES